MGCDLILCVRVGAKQPLNFCISTDVLKWGLFFPERGRGGGVSDAVVKPERSKSCDRERDWKGERGVGGGGIAAVGLRVWLWCSNDAFDAAVGIDGDKAESVVNLTNNRVGVLWVANAFLAAGILMLWQVVKQVVGSIPAPHPTSQPLAIARVCFLLMYL